MFILKHITEQVHDEISINVREEIIFTRYYHPWRTENASSAVAKHTGTHKYMHTHTCKHVNISAQARAHTHTYRIYK